MSFIYKGIIMKACYLVLVLFLKSSIVFSDGYTVSSFHLVDGVSPNEGRVEVTVTNGMRGVLRDDNEEPFTNSEANSVCKQLRYLEAAFMAFVRSGSVFGNGQPSKVFEYEEAGLVELECNPDDSGEDNCSGYQAAGVICQKPGYLGCYRIRNQERDQILRDPNRISEENGIRSNDACLALCRGANIPTLFAAQRDELCLCFDDPAFLNDMRDQADCNRPCTDNNKQLCGSSGGGPMGERYTVFNVSAGFCREISGTNLNVYGRNRFGDIVRANCSGGIRLMGDSVLQCTGGPNSFDWNGTIPTCIDDATVEPTRATNDPRSMDPARTEVGMATEGTLTRIPPTVTGFDKMTDASTMVSVIVNMNARSGSKSLVVQVAVSVVGVVIVAVLAILLILYIVRTRKTRSETKEDFPPSSPESTFNNKSYSMHSIPNNEGPSYYEVRPNAATEGTNDLIDNVLYKPADNIRGDTNEYELAQDPHTDTPRYGLVDNVLYKPVESLEDPHSKSHEVRPGSAGDHVASDNLRQLPIDSEYAYPDDIESRGRPLEGELIDNILYKPADSQVQNGLSSRKYYEIKPGSVIGHHPEADRPSLSNGRYCDIQPEPSHDTSAPSNFEKYDPGYGYDTTELETSDDAGPRFVIKTEPTSPMRQYAGVDNNDGIAFNGTSTSAEVKKKPFPRYAKVQK